MLDSIEPSATPDGAPVGHYTKLIFSRSFEQKDTAQETITLAEESDEQSRTAGYFIK